MRKLSKPTRRIAGFTLIELMVSVAIGSFLMAGVFSVFTNGRQTQGVIEVQTQLIDDARFAIRTLAYDLRHAGLWGRTNNDSLIAGALGVNAEVVERELTTSLPAVVGDCEADWYRNLEQSVFVRNNENPYPPCIPAAYYLADTDVLTLKYAPPTPIADAALAADVVYVYTNFFRGELFVGSPAPQFLRNKEALTPFNYRLKSRAYFVNNHTEFAGDDYPSLHRIDLAAGPSLSNTMLIPGVEDFQIQLGLDIGNNGSVNLYVDADDARLDDDPFFRQVKSVQVWVMLRSRDKEFLDGETQSLSMAGRPAKTFTDGYRRVVVSSVIKLQNRQRYITKAGG